MLTRCYDNNGASRNGLTVDKQWHNFQTFASWYYGQEYATSDHILDNEMKAGKLDLYSPDTATLIPKAMTNLIADAPPSDLPCGVTVVGSKYRAQMTVNGETFYIGTYDTVVQASDAYKAHKTNHVRKQALKYREQLEPAVFKRLASYKAV